MGHRTAIPGGRAGGWDERPLSHSETPRVPWGHYVGSKACSLHEAGMGEVLPACVPPPSHCPSLDRGSVQLTKWGDAGFLVCFPPLSLVLDNEVSSPAVPWEGVQRPRGVFGNFGRRGGA